MNMSVVEVVKYSCIFGTRLMFGRAFFINAFPNQREQITSKPSGQPPNLRANNDSERLVYST